MAVERRGGERPFLARPYAGGRRGPARAFYTRHEAEAWDALARSALLRGEPVPLPDGEAPEARTTTVLDACRDAVRAMRAGTLRSRSGKPYAPGSIDGYERRLRLHVVPYIGSVLIADLDRATVVRMREDLLTVSASAARNATDALRLVVRRCVDHGLIEASPITDLPPMSVTRVTPRFLSRDEALALRERADAHGRIGLIVDLALATGARRGEIEALTWENVRGRAVHVDGLAGNFDRVTRTVGPPKSHAGRRPIPVGPRLWERLERERGEGPVCGRIPWRAWEAVRPAGVRFHDLRHTAATFWLAAGMNVHEVAALLGHTDAGLVLQRYGHALPDRVSVAGEVMEWFLAGGASSGVSAPLERTMMDADA